MYNYHNLIDTSFFDSEMGGGSSLFSCRLEAEVKVLAVPSGFPTTTYSFSFFVHFFTKE